MLSASSTVRQNQTMPKRQNADIAAVAPSIPSESTPDAPPPPKATKRRKKKTTEAASDVSSVAPSSVAPSSVAPTKKRRLKKKKNEFSTRTPSSYVLFSIDHRKTIMENNPDLSLGEVSKQCGKAWKGLLPTQKQPWIDQAAIRKAARVKEVEALKKDLPIKKKRAPSSYLLFAMSHRKVVLEESPGLSIGSVSKACGSAWKSMSDDDKQIWKDKASIAKDMIDVK